MPSREPSPDRGGGSTDAPRGGDDARAALPTQAFYALTATLATLKQVNATSVSAASVHATAELVAPQLRLGNAVLTADSVALLAALRSRMDLLEISVHRISVLESALRSLLGFVEAIGLGSVVYSREGEALSSPSTALLDTAVGTRGGKVMHQG